MSRQNYIIEKSVENKTTNKLNSPVTLFLCYLLDIVACDAATLYDISVELSNTFKTRNFSTALCHVGVSSDLFIISS